jgi:hypothetical protein
MSCKTSTSVSPCVIFLDIDEVIFRQNHYLDNIQTICIKAEQLFPKYVLNRKKPYTKRDLSIAASHFFDFSALKNLDELIKTIEKTSEVWIVISSFWRFKGSVEELKTVFFPQHNFAKYIVDKTVEFDSEEVDICCNAHEQHEKNGFQCRAAEIQYWLNHHPLVKNYFIFDDMDNHLSIGFG